MAMTPTRPRTTLGSLGPSTKLWRGAGRAISDLEGARDFERHGGRGLVEGLAGDDDVDVLELPAGLEVRHEVGDGGGRERGTAELQHGLLLLEAGDPEVAGHGVGEGVEEGDGPALTLGQLLQDIDPALDLGQLALDVGAGVQLGLQRHELAVESLHVGGDARLLRLQAVPVVADAADGDDVEDRERDAEVERGQRQREAGAAARARLDGSEVDPDHFDCSLSFARRNANPTATASAGASAVTSSP